MKEWVLINFPKILIVFTYLNTYTFLLVSDGLWFAVVSHVSRSDDRI